MELIQSVFAVIEVLLFIYFGVAGLYVFIFALAGLFGYTERTNTTFELRKFAVLIPGYKEDNVIVEVARRALEQSYPEGLFEVIIIADSFAELTLSKLEKLPVRLVKVSFEKSTKSKALNKAMEVIGDDYDVALILDADNIMQFDFLEHINSAFNRGFTVVQGHRVAKNTNTAMAILDAISEEVNNHIFRKGHRVLGLSSALIGSGMAFDYGFFKETMAQVNAVGGFDKELELKLLKAGKQIEYLPDALVMDEKVQKSEVFANQRKRWLSAQFVYFQRFAIAGVKELFLRGNIDFADKVYQMITPPRVLLLGVVFVLTVLSFLITSFARIELMLPTYFWLGLVILIMAAFVMAVPKKFYTIKTLKALLTLPKAFSIMLLSLFKLKGANKKFIHTQHGTV